jgi:hypothetical protein
MKKSVKLKQGKHKGDLLSLLFFLIVKCERSASLKYLFVLLYGQVRRKQNLPSLLLLLLLLLVLVLKLQWM